MKTLVTAMALLVITVIAYKIGSSLTKEDFNDVTSTISDISKQLIDGVKKTTENHNPDSQVGSTIKVDSSNVDLISAQEENLLSADDIVFDPYEYIESLTVESVNQKPNFYRSDEISRLNDLLSGEISQETVDSIKAGYYGKIDRNFSSILNEKTP